MKKKIDITGAMAAESALAKEEMQNLEQNFDKTLDELSDSHPLKKLALEEKGKMGGDLSGLPPNHPLLVAMEEAKLRYEERESLEKEHAQYQQEQEKIKIRHAKKLNAKKALADKRRREDEREQVVRVATKRINSSMSETMDSLKRLRDNIRASQEDFAGDSYALMKLQRLDRLIQATMRGVTESKINAGRAVSGGR
jgi:DNA repair exonuclease SbcCD ATPase subunit